MLDSQYEGSDEASESELLDQSLSVWKGRGSYENEAFVPIPLDVHTASSIGQYDCVRNIILRGEEDLNRQNKGGWTPLMYACYIGHDNIVHMLLDAGVNVNVKNTKGQTPLHLAASCGNESVAYFLLQSDADLDSRDRKGWTALFHATYSGHQNMVKFLLNSGSDVEAREPRRGFTPFIEAAAAGHEIIVQYLLQYGVDAEAKALSGHTARSLALDNGHTKIVSLIDNHILAPSLPLRSDAGLSLEGDLSSSDEGRQRPRRALNRGRYKGPSIRDGPEAFNKVFSQAKKRVGVRGQGQGQGQEHESYPAESVVPCGYLTFRDEDEKQDAEADQIRFRDVTSPIGPEDHTLDSSGGKVGDSADAEDDTNAFTKTGALTIKSSSGSSGGLIAALGLSRSSNTSDTEDKDTDDPSSDTGIGSLHRSLSDSVLKGFENLRSEEMRKKNEPTNQNQTPSHLHNQVLKDVRSPEMVMPHPSGLHGAYPYQQPPLNHPDYPQYTQFGGPQQLFPGGGLQPQISAPIYLPQGDLPQKYPISMLQHPLWQQCGYPKPPPNLAQPSRPIGGHQTQQPPSGSGTPQTASQPSSPQKPTNPPPSQARVEGRETGSAKLGLSPTARAEQDEMMSRRPLDLPDFLERLGLGKYLLTFQEQDVDLQVFLSLTDNDLKEVGIKLFGPRRKMTSAIARWHSNARPSHNDLEEAYADKLEADMQEMAIQLKLAKEEVALLKQTAQQEHELRSVAEGCLVKDRVTWQQIQHLATDTRQRCTEGQERLNAIRLYQLELTKRVGSGGATCLTGSGTRDSLAAALKEGLSLEEARRSVPPEIAKLPTRQLCAHLNKLLADTSNVISIATMNTTKVLEASPSSLPGYS